MRDAAVGHAVHDVRRDHDAAIVAADVLTEYRRCGIAVDFYIDDMRFERIARIDLYGPICGGQRATGWHLPYKLRL